MSDGNPEQFSLRWNNFHTNLSSGFHSLLQEEDLVDVTIAVEGKFVQAHKIVLSICSPYFKQLFKINPCKHPIVILKDVGYNEMSGLLQFMYKGEVNIAQEKLPDFLRAAEVLHIKGLTGSETEESRTKKTSKIEHIKKTPPPVKTKRLDSVISQVRVSDDSPSEGHGLTSIPSGSGDVFQPKHEPLDLSEHEGWDGEAFPSVSEAVKLEAQSPVRLTTPTPVSVKTDATELQSSGGFQMTSRGRLQLVRNGYVYHCNRQTEDKIFWKCAEYNRTRCRSRCISVGGSITVTHPNHNHLVRRNYGAPLPSPPSLTLPPSDH